MLHSVISAIAGQPRSIETYYSALLARAPQVAPKFWEARQEYLRRSKDLAVLRIP
ncbi:MAG: hypothetical protein ABIH46_08630 [Chloroflexota bacterium]